jgi:hypothetical protein
MKFSSLAVLCIALAAPLHADTASHRKAADDLIMLVSGPEALKIGFQAVLNPTLASMRQKGATDAQLQEVQKAFNEWLDKEIIFAELKPKMIDVYVHEFSEAELKDLLAFYKTPTGIKAIKTLPVAAAEATKIAQLYAQTKQAGLQTRLNKAMESTAPKKAP